MQTEYDTARNPEVNREAELVRAFDSKAMMEKVDTLIGKVSALGQVVPQQKERADHLLDRIKASESVIERLSHEVADMQNEPVQGIGKLQAEVDTLTDRVDLLADLQALDIDEIINNLDDQLGAFVKWVGERLSDRDTLQERRHAEIMEVLHRLSNAVDAMESRAEVRHEEVSQNLELMGKTQEDYHDGVCGLVERVLLTLNLNSANPTIKEAETGKEQASEDSNHYACEECGWRLNKDFYYGGIAPAE